MKSKTIVPPLVMKYYTEAKQKLQPLRVEYEQTVKAAFARNATDDEIEVIEDQRRNQIDTVLNFNVFRGVTELTQDERNAIAVALDYWDDAILAQQL